MTYPPGRPGPVTGASALGRARENPLPCRGAAPPVERGHRHHGLGGGLAQPSFRSASQDPVLLGRGMTFVVEHEFLVY